MILSSPSNAPPQMNRMFDVSIWMNSCCGCFLPPCGGTLATVPSTIFSSACCTPSPETSRVMEVFFALAGDLIHLVDIDDAALGQLDVEIRRLKQAQQDVLDVLADIAGLGQRGRVGDGEGHLENLREGLGKRASCRCRSGPISRMLLFAARRRSASRNKCAYSGYRRRRRGRSSPDPAR